MSYGLSYDDVLIKPTYSTVSSRSECDTTTYLTEGIKLNIPLIAANMDTVCEAEMAIQMALLGGVGIIHRYMSLKDQVSQIREVKRHTTYFRKGFVYMHDMQTVSDYRDLVANTGIKSFPVLDALSYADGKYVLKGLVTRRDVWGDHDPHKNISFLMTPDNELVFMLESAYDPELALERMEEHKIEQLPIIKEKTNEIVGIVSRKDLNYKRLKYPNRITDSHDRLIVGAAVGVKLNPEDLQPLIEAEPDFLCIDIAHGHHKLTDKTLREIKAYYDIPVIVGNVGTKEAVEYYVRKADGIKVGIGPGCFAAGTRVLMSNGFYKNIEDVQKDDWVINREGKSVRVVRAFSTGVRKVSKLRNSVWYEDTYVTPDHEYWVGDLSTAKESTIASRGYAKVLDTLAKTSPKSSKYKWLPIESGKRKALLMPRRINFGLKEDFKVELSHRTEGQKILRPSFELGYILGMFLSDGHAHLKYNEARNSHSGSVHFYLDPSYPDIIKKTKACLFEVFGDRISEKDKGNVVQVTLNYKPFANYLEGMGKRTQKHLYPELLVQHASYLEGLLEGLWEGDGFKDSDGRVNFDNTSPQLIELFNVVTYLTKGFWPNNIKREKSVGNLKGADIKNFNQGYRSRINKTCEKRLTKDYQACKQLEYSETEKEVEVFDIEVDCETHSFIANNAIVHNSACKTRTATGCGVPQFTAVKECADTGYPYLIADGGITQSGDITKAIFAGASTVMLGSLLAGTSASPGKRIRMDGKDLKQFRGMASHEAYLEKNQKLGQDLDAFHFAAEGASGYVPYRGETEDFVNGLIQGFKSGMSYCGSHTIEELQQYGKLENMYYQVTPMGFSRNGMHNMKGK